MAQGPDAEEDPAVPVEAVRSASLDVEEAAEALDEAPDVVAEAFAEAGVDPDEVGAALVGGQPGETVGALAEALERSQVSVAVALADALRVPEDALVDLAHGLEADPGEFAQEIRRVHLGDLLQDVDVAGWLPWDDPDETPTLEEVVRVARASERRVLAGGLVLALTLVILGVVMFNAPPVLREVLWIVVGVLLVAAGAGLIVALVRLSVHSDRYLDRLESLAEEFEGGSVSVVTEVAQQTDLGRRAREAALRQAWTAFRAARARRAREEDPEDGEEGEAGEPPDGAAEAGGS